MAASDLVRVRYSGMDFTSIEDELLSRLQVNFASVYNDFVESSLGIMLIDLFSFGLDTLSWYLDRRATDLFISTARTRKSVSRAARQIGYKMSPAVSSSVDVTITPAKTYAFAIPLNIGFQLLGPNNLIFEARQAYTWPASNINPKTLTFSEGQTVEAIFASDGLANQVFEVRNVPSGKFIAGPGSDGVSQSTVTVAGVEWAESDLLTFGATNQYELGYNDDPPTLRFGDSIAGNIPPPGAEIRIKYFASSGAAGSATSGTIQKAFQQLVVSFTNIELVINNGEGTSGGSDPESLEKARAYAPKFFKSRGVNITREDYEGRAGSFTDSVFGAIAVARAVTVRNASSDAYLGAKLSEITVKSAVFPVVIGAAATSINSTLGGLASKIVSCQDADSIVVSSLSTIDTKTQSISTSSGAGKTSAGIAQLVTTEIAADASNTKDFVGGLPSGGSDALTPTTRGIIVNALTSMQAKASTANTETTSVLADLTSITTDNGSVISAGKSAGSSRLASRTQIDSLGADIAGITGQVNQLVATTSAMDSNVSLVASDISAHVGSFLSSDCQSNLVEVPVLTLDSDGFYVVPTISLLKTLQVYLDAKKEVTQVVKVVGASNTLVRAEIAVHVGVLAGYTEQTVRSQVEAEILKVLRKRNFGDRLEQSELYWGVSPLTGTIAGIKYVQIKIIGPTDHIDVDGNLTVSEFEVVTRGTITVTSEPAKA